MRLALLADIHDESTTDVRLVLEPKSRNVDPEHLMEQLFRQTDLETRFGSLLHQLCRSSNASKTRLTTM